MSEKMSLEFQHSVFNQDTYMYTLPPPGLRQHRVEYYNSKLDGTNHVIDLGDHYLWC